MAEDAGGQHDWLFNRSEKRHRDVSTLLKAEVANMRRIGGGGGSSVRSPATALSDSLPRRRRSRTWEGNPGPWRRPHVQSWQVRRRHDVVA
jgi:hypothetical protein